MDTKAAISALTKSLLEVEYRSRLLKVTKLMRDIPTGVELRDVPLEVRYISRIEYANSVRAAFDIEGDESSGNDALALLSIAAIRQARPQTDVAERGVAYIIDQFKRPEEVLLMRRVYPKDQQGRLPSCA